MSYLEHCHYRSVDGVVIACVNFNDPQVVELVNSDVPVVTIDHVFNNRMAILLDNVVGPEGSGAAGMGLRPPPHRFYPRRKDRRYREPRCRLLSGLRRAGAEDPGSLCAVRASTTMPTAAQPRPKRCWHCRSGPPASSSRMTFPRWAATTPSARAGLSIPEDISVMGYDGIYLSRVVKPSAGDLPAEHQNAGQAPPPIS